MTVGALRATLAGTAPADVFNLAVSRNGAFVSDPELEVAFSTSDMTAWTIRNLALGGGVNDIEVLGFGSRGQLVDAAAIRITSTIAWEPPSIATVAPPQGAAGDRVAITGTGFHDGLAVAFGGVGASVSFDEVADPTRITAVVPPIAAGPATIVVRNIDGKESAPAGFTVLPPAPRFVRGDANLDERVDLSDAVKLVGHLFRGLAAGCADALDADDSGALNITDAIFVLEFVFRGGASPPPPFPARGVDPTGGDALGCAGP
jgi:hypothetical protein